MNEKIKTLSLFAGIGGIDLGLEATGYFETVQFVEYDPYCQHILKRHWPDVAIWGDVKTFDPDSCGEIDCIVGGYPCQPFSVAGKQKGTQDDRHLWPRMFEIIKHKRPSLILCENVSGHIVLGLDEVLLDLEGEGYSTRAFVIPASAVDANHKRERVWIIGSKNDTYTNSFRSYSTQIDKQRETESLNGKERIARQVRKFLAKPKKTSRGDTRNVAYANNTGDRTSQRRTDKDRQKINEGQAEQPQSQSSRQSTNVVNTDSRMRRGGRAIKSSGENKQRRIHTTQEKQTSHDIRSETIGCDTVRGEAEDVPNTQGKGLEGQRIDRETSRSKETGELNAQSSKDREQYQQGSIERRLGGVVDGVPSWLDEPNIPRVTTNQTGKGAKIEDAWQCSSTSSGVSVGISNEGAMG